MASAKGSASLTAAAVLTWVTVGVSPVRRLADDPTEAGAWPTLALWLGFGAAFSGLVFAHPGRRASLALLSAASICGLALVWLEGAGLATALLVMSAIMAGLLLPGRAAVAWAAAQSAAAVAPWAAHRPVTALTVAGALFGFQLFAIGVIALTSREAAAREELARVNAELRAAQARLEDWARLEERLRIARDLHDTLGHHLTALSLNLEAAAHLAAGAEAPHLERARAVTRLLLAEVRDVVGALRADRPLDLRRALADLAAAVAEPRVHLEVTPAAGLGRPELAHVLLRIAQEVITNAARHSAARHLWIEIGGGVQEVQLHARDDGRGVREVRYGNGLRGMKERLEAAGGSLRVASSPGRGFEVTASLPVTAAS